MRVLSCAFNIFFPCVREDLKLHILEMEKDIKNTFQAFNINSIPEDAPFEIPRASAVSKNGHSVLNVTPRSLVLNVNFDDKYNTDPRKCLEYTEHKIQLIYEQMCKHLSSRFYYSGMVIQLDFEGVDMPANYIGEKFLSKEHKNGLFDLSIRFTKVQDNTYYINTEIGNKRALNYPIPLAGDILPLCKISSGKESIGVTVDINDRYAFNFKNGYMSNIDQIHAIVKIAESFLSGKVQRLVEKGEIDYA